MAQSNQANSASVDPDQVVHRLAELLTEAAPLARYLESDDVPGEYRAKLREQVGGREYFRLTNVLNNLCSESARAIARARSEDERPIHLQRSTVGASFDGDRLRIERRRDKP